MDSVTNYYFHFILYVMLATNLFILIRKYRNRQ